MAIRTQFILIVCTILFFIGLLRIIRKGKIANEIAILWIIFALTLVFIALFPSVAITIGKLLGIMSTINAVYLIMIFILLCFVFYLLLKISKLEKKVDDLIQRYAIDKHEEKL